MTPAADAKKIRVETDCRTGTPGIIAGDPDRLQQIVWNLLSNAIKFTPNDGRVEVRAGARRRPRARSSSRDTGAGISPEFLPHVFDRFRQEDAGRKRRYGGLGLGLAIVRHLVELHGGSVVVESDGQDHGSTFSVRLPVGAGILNTDGPASDQAALESAIRELRALLGSRATDAAAVREHHSHGESYHAPAAPDVVCFPRTTDEVAAILRDQRPASGAGRPVRRRHFARRARQRDPRRHHHRPSRDERGRARQRRGPRRDRRGRRHAAAAEQGAAQHRPHLPRRSWRRRDDRRHGGHPRLGHDRRALRHHARERAGPDRRARRRPRDHDRHARAKVGGRLRPDAPVRRIGGHARRHHRGHGAAASAARGGVGGGLRVRFDRRARSKR